MGGYRDDLAAETGQIPAYIFEGGLESCDFLACECWEQKHVSQYLVYNGVEDQMNLYVC